jgi:hypothetical protein
VGDAPTGLTVGRIAQGLAGKLSYLEIGRRQLTVLII